jgi:hypothetical protein
MKREKGSTTDSHLSFVLLISEFPFNHMHDNVESESDSHWSESTSLSHLIDDLKHIYIYISYINNKNIKIYILNNIFNIYY